MKWIVSDDEIALSSGDFGNCPASAFRCCGGAIALVYISYRCECKGILACCQFHSVYHSVSFSDSNSTPTSAHNRSSWRWTLLQTGVSGSNRRWRPSWLLCTVGDRQQPSYLSQTIGWWWSSNSHFWRSARTSAWTECMLHLCAVHCHYCYFFRNVPVGYQTQPGTCMLGMFSWLCFLGLEYISVVRI